MRIDSIQQYVRLRRELDAERQQLEARLRDINEALGEMAPSSLSSTQASSSSAPSEPARRGRIAAGGGQSLRDHVIAVLQGGPMTKEEVLSAVQNRGYRFSTSNPLISLGVILFGRNPKFNRVDGRFSLSGAPATSVGGRKMRGRRTMSPQARARIAAAQRARYLASRNQLNEPTELRLRFRLHRANRKPRTRHRQTERYFFTARGQQHFPSAATLFRLAANHRGRDLVWPHAQRTN